MEKPEVGGSTSAEDLIKAAHMLLDEYGVSLSASKVSRIVRTYKHQVEKNGFPFVDFLINQIEIAHVNRQGRPDNGTSTQRCLRRGRRVIRYADPTGEDAVRNVHRHLRKDSLVNTDYFDSNQLEELTGTPASTWRYWAHIGSGPASFKLGRRRVWKKEIVLQWLADQEAASA